MSWSPSWPGTCYVVENNRELLTLPPKYCCYRHVDHQAWLPVRVTKTQFLPPKNGMAISIEVTSASAPGTELLKLMPPQ